VHRHRQAGGHQHPAERDQAEHPQVGGGAGVHRGHEQDHHRRHDQDEHLGDGEIRVGQWIGEVPERRKPGHHDRGVGDADHDDEPRRPPAGEPLGACRRADRVAFGHVHDVTSMAPRCSGGA
jgi:hypothetical protein